MSDGTEGEKIIVLEGRVDGLEKRTDKIDINLQRVWERMDKHTEGQVRTRTLMEVVDKNVGEVKQQITKLNETFINTTQKSNEEQVKRANKWEKFFAKAFNVAVGALVSLAIYVLTHK